MDAEVAVRGVAQARGLVMAHSEIYRLGKDPDGYMGQEAVGVWDIGEVHHQLGRFIQTNHRHSRNRKNYLRVN